MISKIQIGGVQALKTYANRRRDRPATVIAQLSQTVDANLSMIYGFLEDVMTNMNMLEEAMEKSATREEFKQTKAQLKRVIRDASKPSKEEIEKHKQIEKNARHVYR